MLVWKHNGKKNDANVLLTPSNIRRWQEYDDLILIILATYGYYVTISLKEVGPSLKITLSVSF